MAKSRGPSREPSVVGSRSSMLIKTIVTIVLVLIVMIGVTILIIWLAIKPRRPIYFINDGLVHDYKLSKDRHLNASFHFVVNSINPSKKMSLYYDKMKITVLFDHGVIASGVINSWHQHKGNKSFKSDLVSHNVELSGVLPQDLQQTNSSNKVVLDVKLKGRIRSKLGIWVSRYSHMEVSCVHVVARFSSSSNGSRGALCDVDI